MERENPWRRVGLFVSVAVWAFLLLSLGSFHANDWPSHRVFPFRPVQNIGGKVGSLIAYYMFLVIGQGVFPVLFFSGICLALYLFRNRVSDMWLRSIGLVVLSVAFAAMIHNLRPGSVGSFPEGHGGIIGIGASSFLQQHFNTVGTRLILLTGILVGLLLAADDLVLKTPGLVNSAVTAVK